jgi:aryl-alcohol dehydrogenase-like predicted oxidoreductase
VSGSARLGLGTVQWGMPYGIANTTGQPATSDVGDMLRAAKQRGIHLLDTAAGYGTAEDELGKWDVGSQGFQIVTKIVPVSSNVVDKEGVARITAAFRASLQRLNSNGIYGLMTHRADDLLLPGGNRLWDALNDLKDQGQVSKIGVSVYTPDQLAGILDRFPIDIVQLPFSVYDQRFLRTGMLDRLKLAGVEIHSRSTFLQGLLLIPPDRLPFRFAPIRQHHLQYFEALGAAAMVPLEGSLCFCLAQPQIDCVLVGCESIRQLNEILDVVDSCSGSTNGLESFGLDDENVINPSRWIDEK